MPLIKGDQDPESVRDVLGLRERNAGFLPIHQYKRREKTAARHIEANAASPAVSTWEVEYPTETDMSETLFTNCLIGGIFGVLLGLIAAILIDNWLIKRRVRRGRT